MKFKFKYKFHVWDEWNNLLLTAEIGSAHDVMQVLRSLLLRRYIPIKWRG